MSDKNSVCNEAVYNKVYNEHSEAVWRFIYFKCGDSTRADDLIQDAFIKLWQNCAKVPFEKAKSYLYTLANNAFLNEVAHHKVVLKHQQTITSYTDNQTPEYLLEEKQYKEKLGRAIANLTEAQRTAFLLNRIEGKKYREIAELLNISVKAVEKRMSQALSSLRKEIKNI